MTWILATLCAVWLLPVAWVVRVNIRNRRRYSRKTTIRDAARYARRMLAWPPGLIDWLRGL